MSDFLVTERTTQQSTINQENAITISPYVENNDPKMLFSTLSENSQKFGGRFLVVSPDRIVISDSFSELNGTKLDSKEVNDIISRGMDQSHSFYESKLPGGGTNYSVNFASGIYADGSLIGVSVYIASFNDIHQKIADIYLNIFTIAFVASVAVFLLTLASSNYITKPLTNFSNAIQNISAGNFDTEIEVIGQNELKQLAESFNLMSKKLQNIDRLRNEFVSNASHELRTPLASIKILIQNMIYEPDMPADMQQEFLTDIDAEIDRLNSIIEDLLMLVQASNTKSVLRLSSEDIPAMLKGIIEKLEPIARQKNITLHLESDEETLVNCDKIKMQICFSNLIDNAIKYGEDGGNVYVSCNKNGNNIIVQISDDGLGIPGHDLPNIFDRFYRVDKTRSRASGGTGLGLSITQRIILLHNGTVDVDSKLGEGTTFTITLPINE